MTQIGNSKTIVGHWILVIEICLGFGICDLEFRLGWM